MQDIPLLIDFAAPTSLLREQNRLSTLPIVGNGPPGTFVLFPDGLRVSLPTDQIVFADDTGGHARVGFGGMRFAGSEEGAWCSYGFANCFPRISLAARHLTSVRTNTLAPITPSVMDPSHIQRLRVNAATAPNAIDT